MTSSNPAGLDVFQNLDDLVRLAQQDRILGQVLRANIAQPFDHLDE